MATRPLEKLPSIRAKLGSTIVVAVGITLLISYALIGFALRDSPRDSEAIDALQAREAGRERRAARDPVRHRDRHPQPGRERHDRGGVLSVNPADLLRMASRTGAWSGRITYASVPTERRRVGDCDATVPEPRLARPGVGDPRVPPEHVVAVPAGRRDRGGDLPADRALARPRHDPAAPRHGGGRAADGDGRLHRAGRHDQPRRGGPARGGVQPDERGAGGTWRSPAAISSPTSPTS